MAVWLQVVAVILIIKYRIVELVDGFRVTDFGQVFEVSTPASVSDNSAICSANFAMKIPFPNQDGSTN